MFNHIFYNNFHLDIKSLQLNKEQLEQSYQLYGKKEGRISCEEDFYKVYPDFDIEFYKNYHTDLLVFKEDKYLLMWHYHNCGKKEGRIANKKYLKKDLEKDLEEKTNQFPALFHKYVLNLVEPTDNLNYIVMNKGDLKKKELCHVHCYKISFLQSMFDEHIELLSIYFDILVTFSISDDTNVISKYIKNNITFIQCENKGYDIGPKFIICNYLEKEKVDYKYIFFIHSKSFDEKRKEYLEPFFYNLKEIKTVLQEEKIGGIFNDIIYCANQVIYIHNQLIHTDIKKIYWNNNDIYMNEFIRYFNLNKENYLFSEGNFFILHRKVIEKLYYDEHLYYALNNETSFDYSWVKKRYGIHEKSLEKVFEEYKTKKWFGNNMETRLGWCGFPDGMLEHSFERLPLIMTNHLNMEIKIVSKLDSPNISLIERLVNSKINNKEAYHYF
jgi:hypothetical protein